jgi:WD40 repeat protein
MNYTTRFTLLIFLAGSLSAMEPGRSNPFAKFGSGPDPFESFEKFFGGGSQQSQKNARENFEKFFGSKSAQPVERNSNQQKTVPPTNVVDARNLGGLNEFSPEGQFAKFFGADRETAKVWEGIFNQVNDASKNQTSKPAQAAAPVRQPSPMRKTSSQTLKQFVYPKAPQLVVSGINIPVTQEEYRFADTDERYREGNTFCFAPEGNVACVHKREYTFDAYTGDRRSGGKLEKLRDPIQGYPYSATFNNGFILSVGNNEGMIQTRHVYIRSGNHPLQGHTGIVSGLDASPTDAHNIVSCGHDGKVRVWDLIHGESIAAQKDSDTEWQTVQYAPGGNVVAAQAYNDLVRLWDMRLSSSHIVHQSNRKNNHPGLAFSPDENTLATVSYENIYLVDLRTNKLIPTTMPTALSWGAIFFVGTKLFGVRKWLQFDSARAERLINYDTVTDYTEYMHMNFVGESKWHKWTHELSFEGDYHHTVYNFLGLLKGYQKEEKLAAEDKKLMDDFVLYIDPRKAAIALVDEVLETVRASLSDIYKNDDDLATRLTINAIRVRDTIQRKNDQEIEDIMQNMVPFKEEVAQGLLKDFPDCPICFELYADVTFLGGAGIQRKALCCGQIFCVTCFALLLQNNEECPLCCGLLR